MKGFDQKWKDFPDFIIGITKEIWENRDISSLKHYYSNDIPVRSPGSLVIGNNNVIAATVATLAEFPDRTLLGEDVIWSGNPEIGMLSSHRIYTTATHLGNGAYGNATGKKLKYRVIADCHAKNNRIDDEWLVRDQGAIVLQLGLKPKNYARDLIKREGGYEHCVVPFNPKIDVTGPYKGKGNNNEWGEKYANILQNIMGSDFSIVSKSYDRACQLEYPNGKNGTSRRAVDEFWMSLRSSFPSAKFSIEHQIGREDPLMPPRAAIRFSLYGKHDGWGRFGKPTGANVYVMGAAHVEFGPWGLRREFVLFDEIAIWKQIILQTG